MIYTDPDFFFAGTLNQNIEGALFTDTDQFFAGTLTLTQKINGALFTDPDTFFTGTIQAGQVITGALFPNINGFFDGSIRTNIAGALFTDGDTFNANIIRLEVVLFGGAGTRITGRANGRTVETPNSPFPGGISQAFYTDQEDDFFDQNDIFQGLSNSGLYVQAVAARDALEAAVLDKDFQPLELDPENYYLLERANVELSRRGLSKVYVRR